MVQEKKRVAGELVAWLIMYVRQAVWADNLPGFDKLNPYTARVAPKPVSEERRRRETQAAFRVIEKALFGRALRV
jgi:hypothetical protein